MNNGIEHVRIDERLIHGQVATMWINTLKTSRIMVVDDVVVKSDIEKAALKTAVPEGIHLSILTAQGAIRNILTGKYQGQKVLLITRTTHILKDMFDAGVQLPFINIGNMSAKPGGQQFKKSVFLTPDDLNDLHYLHTKGVKIIAQMVPTEKIQDFADLLK